MRLAEPRRHLQVVAGSRQVGKTTLVRQVVEASGLPGRFASADEPTLRGTTWIEQQWEAARLTAGDAGKAGAVLVLDEIQKIPGWSESVKRLWDEDTAERRRLKVVTLGSSPLLVAEGLTESLAGRFEVLHLPHWSFAEMRDGFDVSLDEFLFYGAYPGAAHLIRQPRRWARYILGSLIETSISRDVLLLTRVDKFTIDGVDCDVLAQTNGLGCPVGSSYVQNGSLDVDGHDEPEVWFYYFESSGPPDYIYNDFAAFGPYGVAATGGDGYTLDLDLEVGGPGTPLPLSVALTDRPGYTSVDGQFRSRGGSSIEMTYLGRTWIFEKQF